MKRVEELIKLCITYGSPIVFSVYLLWFTTRRISVILDKYQETLAQIVVEMRVMNERIDSISDKVGGGK